MAEASADQATIMCIHCDRAVPSCNTDLDNAHCSRDLEKCKVCGDTVPEKFPEEHFSGAHAEASCSLCSETMDRSILDVHRRESCPQRIVTCEYCQFLLPAIDLVEHQEVCGNRMGLCRLCRRYIQLREKRTHETRCTGPSDISTIPESRDTRPAEMTGGAPRRQLPREISPIRLVFSIVIAWIAFLLSSLFFHRKPHPSSVVLN